MLRSFKIRNRLIIGYLVILIVSTTASIVAIVDINKIFNATKDLYEKPYMVSNYLREIKFSALNMRRYMLDIVIIDDTTTIDEFVKEIDLEEQKVIKNFQLVSAIYIQDKLEIEKSFNFFVKWKPIRDDVIALKKKGDPKTSKELMTSRNRRYVIELFNKMQNIIDKSSKNANSFYLSAEKTKNGVITSLMVLLVISISLSVTFAYLITKSIVDPLSEIVEKIDKIARGFLNNKRIPESKDEIGQLAVSFNNMQDDLQYKSHIAQQIANGNFSDQVIPSGENDMVADSINMIAYNFDIVVKQAQRVAAGDFEMEVSQTSKDNPLNVVIAQMFESLKEVVNKARQVASGDYSGEIIPKSTSDELAIALNEMTKALRTSTEQNARQNRLKTAQNELNENMRGDLTLEEMANNVISYIAGFTHSQVGSMYIFNEERAGYELKGSFAIDLDKGGKDFYKEGESLIGQAAREKKMLTCYNLPDDIKISSGLFEVAPKNIIIVPLLFENNTIGVIELGSVNQYNKETYSFLELIHENIAISVLSGQNRLKMAKLLEITTAQAEELQVQQEELRQTNEELELQTTALKKSEESLQNQQEELRVTNEELEEKTRKLEEHKTQMERQNQDLENARHYLELKAKELEITSKYKSEFLANMSHELRTPLNSLLILAQHMMENKENNLSQQQLESATIIYNSGNDLLNLINDILDLSKIESGKMNVSFEKYSISKINDSIHAYFGHITKEKGLELSVNIQEDVPQYIVTDEQRLNQIIRNLMSNAIKFTEAGSIQVNIFKPFDNEDLSRSRLLAKDAIAISVKDTGIGIPHDKQLEIFEAFHQADGSTSRKYGGTGLGLSITRELTKLLGGEIKLHSSLGNGSEFTLLLPENAEAKTKFSIPILSPVIIQKTEKKLIESQPKNYSSIPDDRLKLSKDKNCILIIEDDLVFAETIAKICRDKGIQYLSACTGEEGIKLARKHAPKGIILDINLPEMNGWEVLELLKNSPQTRHIPVHVISVDIENIEAYNKGVWGYLEKPVTKEQLDAAFNNLQAYFDRKIKNLLIVEDDENLRKSMKILLGADDIRMTESSTAKEAIKLIKANKFDCVVLDLGLPGISGSEMLKILKEQNIKLPPVVIYTGKAISREEHLLLQQYTQNIIMKGAKSEERLLDETSLFLHRVINDMPDHQKKMMINLYNKDEMFRDKIILVVDDDMRNVFALTQALEASNMRVLMAPNGKSAVEIVEKEPKIDLVLMDIMMPVMNGYEAMKAIRKDKRFEDLPIIALTAKAMKEDQEKSIMAGANDYLSKPVEMNKLFNLMRIWLYQ